MSKSSMARLHAAPSVARDAAVRDADAHAAGTVEWTAIEANERGRGGGGAGGATERGGVGGDERERAAKRAKRGLQLAADVAGD